MAGEDGAGASTQPLQRSEYLTLRRPYEPATVRLIIVAESPPVSGLYFYDRNGSTSEPLFSAIMKQIGCSPTRKEAGLREIQERGWVLVDATYEPVNAMSQRRRDETIIRDYPHLLEDLLHLSASRTAPLVLLKANVCPLLEPKLVSDGWNVINRGRPINFPSHGHQPKFHAQFRAVLTEAGIS